jgi:hypothetical protein
MTKWYGRYSKDISLALTQFSPSSTPALQTWICSGFLLYNPFPTHLIQVFCFPLFRSSRNVCVSLFPFGSEQV